MSVKIISEYIDFEVDLGEWNDDELIEEIEKRCYEVVKQDPIEKELTSEELEALRDMLRDSEIGTVADLIYEKIRKR